MLEEGQILVGLKERLFRLLGHDALDELKDRIGRDVSEDIRVVLLVHFDNGKVAYCGNKELKVTIPSGAKGIASIEIVAFKEFTGLKQLAIRVLDDPGNTDLKGELGEVITKELLMDSILDEISRRSGIPKGRLNVTRKGRPGPDFVVGKIGTTMHIAVIEVKYVGNVENVKDFERQLSHAVKQIKERMADPKWEVPHGVIVVIAWSPEQILAHEPRPNEELRLPEVGGYKNPYTEFFSKEGG